MPENKGRIRLVWWAIRNYSHVRYDRSVVMLELKVRMLEAKVVEVMLYDCAAWSTKKDHHDKQRSGHHVFLCIGEYSKRPENVIWSVDVLERNGRARILRQSSADGNYCLPDESNVWTICAGPSGWWRDDWTETQEELPGDQKTTGNTHIGRAQLFEINGEWYEQGKDQTEWYQTVENEATKFMQKWTVTENCHHEEKENGKGGGLD